MLYLYIKKEERDTTMANINKIQLSDGTYEIEALHFFNSSVLDTPAQWKDYIDSQIATAAKIQLIVDQ